jgi:hypothetical protein
LQAASADRQIAHELLTRQELVARVFHDDYLPQPSARTPLASSGGFADFADELPGWARLLTAQCDLLMYEKAL